MASGHFGTSPSMGCSSRICKLACLPCANRCGLANPPPCGRPYPLRLAVRAISPRPQKSSTGDGTHRLTGRHAPALAAPPPLSHGGHDTAPDGAARAVARVMGGSKKNPPTPPPLGPLPAPRAISFSPNHRKYPVAAARFTDRACAATAWPAGLLVGGGESVTVAGHEFIFSLRASL